MPVNRVPFGYNEGELDKELAGLGFSQDAITAFYGAWQKSGKYYDLEDAVDRALADKPVRVEGWVMGEWDSYGPLSRGVKLTFPDGRKVCAYYF